MAALTWRDVSGPNFGGVSSALNGASNSLDRAFSGLSEGLKQFKTDQEATIDGQILANALTVNDPKAYQQHLNNGDFLQGVDPSRVSARTIQALGSRYGDLLNQAATTQRMDVGQYAFDRTKSDNTIADNARGASARQNNITDEALAALSVDQQQAYLQKRSTLTGSNLSNDTADTNLKIRKRDDADSQAGIAGAVNAIRRSAGPDDALGNLEETLAGMTPAAQAKAIAGVTGIFGNVYNPAGTAAPSGGGGKGKPAVPGTQSGSPYDATYGFAATNKPLTSTKIGDVLSLQDGMRSGSGHTPVGAFQITQDTLNDYGPKVLGANYKDHDLTPENQEKLAQAIFEDRKGSDLSKTWSSLPNSTPGAYKDFSWNEMRQVLSNGEVGQNLPDDPGTLRDLSRSAGFEINRRVAQNNSVGTTADVFPNLTKSSDIPTVVQELIKTKYPGGDAQSITRQVMNGMQNNPNLSAADVAAAISRSTSPASSVPFTRNFLGTSDFGGGVGIDDKKFLENLKSQKSGVADNIAQDNQQIQAEGQYLANAQQAYDTALSELQSLKGRQSRQPGISTDRAEAKVERVTKALQRALSDQQSDPRLRPTR